MELTRELLLDRRRSLEADLIALNGALQQIDWSLDKLAEPEGEEEAPSG
jgi:hypothetical protein